MLNVPLLQKALDHIEAHPEEWEQESWGVKTPCGTRACLAGHITLIDEWAPVQYGMLYGDWIEVERDGERMTVADAARISLGVSDVDAYIGNEYIGYLWAGSNTRADLWKIANVLAEGQLTLPADLQE